MNMASDNSPVQGPKEWTPNVVNVVCLIQKPNGENVEAPIELTTEQLGIEGGRILAAATAIRWTHKLTHSTRVRAAEGKKAHFVKAGNTLSYTTESAEVQPDYNDPDLHRIAKEAKRRA